MKSNLRNNYSFVKLLDYSKINYFLFSLLAITIPLSQKASTLILLLLFITSLTNLKKFKLNKHLVPLVLLYLTYVLFEIIHFPIDYKIFEKKATFLALPMIFILNKFSISELNKILNFFVFGVLSASIVCYINAFYYSLSFSDGIHFNPFIIEKSNKTFLESSVFGGNRFLGNVFSIFHQSVYFSMYINLSVLILLYSIKARPIYKYIMIVFFGLVIFQISNKVNLFIYLLIISQAVLFYVKSNLNRVISVVCLLGTVIFIITKSPRTNIFLDKIVDKEYTIDREADDSFGTRVLTWDASLTLLKKNYLFGLGPSSVYDELKKTYKEKRYVVPFRERLNSHNQYLQITLETGLLGLFLMTFILINMIIFMKTEYKFFAFGILMIFFINGIFESIFNRYSGIICFCFFYCILVYLCKKQNKNAYFLSK